MAGEGFDALFGTLAQWTQNNFASLQNSSDDVMSAVKSRAAGAGVDWPDSFLQVLDSIDQTAVDTALERHGPNVPADDALLTGAMMRLDRERHAAELTLREVVDAMASGVPVLIGGADANLDDFFDEALDLLDPLATDTILVQ